MWKILAVVCASWALAETKVYHHHKREISTSLCDPLGNNTSKVQCYCTRNILLVPYQIKKAECFLTINNVDFDDLSWSEFSTLNNITKLSFTNTRGMSLKYVPTKALEHTKALTKLNLRYGNIEHIPAFAFANLTHLEEIIVRENHIKTLGKYAFAHHLAAKSISLDDNEIEEINRDVFVDLPALEKLYFSSNIITTIHDKAFMHLSNLRELEIDKNHLFSLNSETFYGLAKLERLVLSSNSLEVIGAKTFVNLPELKSLSLDGNQIQMLDEKAFNGLAQLSSLTLARNKLVTIDSVKTFEGLNNLKSLSLKDNQITKIKEDVMAPILQNFYGETSFFDSEGNKFPCECHLDWFLRLMNRTQSTLLKNSIHNLKCYPNDALRESWKKFDATEFDEQQQEQEPQNQNDYEYYDESSLNGTLFYTDVRVLLNCIENIVIPTPSYNIKPTEISIKSSDPLPRIPVSTTTTHVPNTSKVTDRGLSDLSELESVTTEIPKTVTDSRRDINKVTERNEKKVSPTTSRLATVSAKPIDKSYDERDMASDEAKPEKLNSRRNYQDDIKPEEQKVNINNSQRNAGCVMLTSIIIMLSLRSFL